MFCTICHHLLLLILIATTLTVNNIQVMAKLSKEDHRQSPRSGDPPAALAHEYRRTENSVSSINYHFVFVPKRRKPVLVSNVAKRLQEIIFELVQEHNWRLIALEIQPDHVHMFINAPTDEAPSKIAMWVKGRASAIQNLDKY